MLSVFAGRRQRLLDALGDGLLILPTAPETLRNGDVHHEYRPGSEFTYLCGFAEPEAVLVAWREGARHRAELFVRPRDREMEIWNGRRAGVRGALRTTGVDAAHEIGALWDKMPALIGDHTQLFYALGRDRAFDDALLACCRKVAIAARRRRTPANPAIVDPTPALAEQRIVKAPEEIALLERAAEVTAAGHVAAMRAARPGATEYQVQAALEAEFRRRGSPRNGYPSIVASGANACILHYVENRRTMRSGDLLLIDAGAELGGYTADITRTFPVNGTFSQEQRAVYRIVLRAQKAGIRAAKAGAGCDAPHRACVRHLTKGLVELGVLRGDPAALIKRQAYRPYYMHGTSHWLGLDVHDAGVYQRGGRAAPLQAGNVLTVEPGLYFGTDRQVPRALRGIGIRIEDDVLVTDDGPRVLSGGVPKEITEVERACQA